MVDVHAEEVLHGGQRGFPADFPAARLQRGAGQALGAQGRVGGCLGQAVRLLYLALSLFRW
jgi:hypothetical protein